MIINKISDNDKLYDGIKMVNVYYTIILLII